MYNSLWFPLRSFVEAYCKSPVIQQSNKMKDIWRIFALNDCFLQYLNFVILSILVRNAAQQKCESEGNKRGRHKEC